MDKFNYELLSYAIFGCITLICYFYTVYNIAKIKEGVKKSNKQLAWMEWKKGKADKAYDLLLDGFLWEVSKENHDVSTLLTLTMRHPTDFSKNHVQKVER